MELMLCGVIEVDIELTEDRNGRRSDDVLDMVLADKKYDRSKTDKERDAK